MAKVNLSKRVVTTTVQEVDLPNLPGNDLAWEVLRDGVNLTCRGVESWVILGTANSYGVTLARTGWTSGIVPQLSMENAAKHLCDALGALDAAGVLT